MRLPNSYGTVYKMGGKRRRPYVAKKFTGWKVDEETKNVRPIYGTIGYFETKSEALQALAKYNVDPTDLNKKKSTFSEIYKCWSDVKFKSISKSLSSNYNYAYSYLKPFYHRNFKEITVFEYEEYLKGDIPRTTVKFIKIVLSQMYQYAIKHEIVNKDVSKMISINTDYTSHVKRHLFTNDEVESLFAMERSIQRDMILFSLYTGMRPNEILKIKIKDIDLDKRILVGGSKTTAGIGRRVPIHKRILEIVQFNMNGKSDDDRLFDSTYRIYFDGLQRIFPDHVPYETRHTFATCWHLSGSDHATLDPLIEKLIMGHAINDVTGGVYTHLPDTKLVSEMDRYYIQ